MSQPYVYPDNEMNHDHRRFLLNEKAQAYMTYMFKVRRDFMLGKITYGQFLSEQILITTDELTRITHD